MSSLANQEDAARATAHAREEDVVFARDYAAIVEALRIHVARFQIPEDVGLRVCNQVAHGEFALSEYQPYVFFAEQWGFPALLRALARAIELETK